MALNDREAAQTAFLHWKSSDEAIRCNNSSTIANGIAEDNYVAGWQAALNQAQQQAIGEIYEVNGSAAVDLWDRNLCPGTKLFITPQPDRVAELEKQLSDLQGMVVAKDERMLQLNHKINALEDSLTDVAKLVEELPVATTGASAKLMMIDRALKVSEAAKD